MPYRIFIFLLMLVCPLADADEAAETVAPQATAEEAVLIPQSARSRVERDEMQARAKQLRESAKLIKQAAVGEHKAADVECWKKFLVSSCLEEARITHRNTDQKARQMERDARLLERNVNRFDAAERASQRAADNAKKDADIAKKEARSAASGK